MVANWGRASTDGRWSPTLCWRSRKGSSINMPPSWTTHHTSMWPSVKRSPLDG